MKQIQIWTNEEGDYKLLDSGDHKKLEKIKDVVIVRSEPRAWWKPELDKSAWDKAVAVHEKEEKGGWKMNSSVPEEVEIDISGLKSLVRFTKMSKHIGLFPEQSSQWKWIQEVIKKQNRPLKVLNLFGYTGLASLALAKGGAEVTHVDGSRAAIGWAKDNQVASGLENKPIRWILDDAITFMKREVKRGVRYDGIIMDPPSYGKGPNGEIWKIENELDELLKLGREVLSDNPLFLILNIYATELSPIALGNLLEDTTKGLNGEVEVGELTLKHVGSERLLPMSISAVWRSPQAMELQVNS